MKFIKRVLSFLLNDYVYDLIRLYYNFFRIKFNFSYIDEHEVNLQKCIINKNDVVLDIGSNWGYFTCRYSQFIDKGGKVYSFEPFQRLYSLQMKILKLLNIKNVYLFNTALGENNTEGFLQIPKNDLILYDSMGYLDVGKTVQNNENDLARFKIKTTSIDNFVHEQNIKTIDFVKIDVEGFELFVLKGAMDTLNKMKPIFYLETIAKHYQKYNYTVADIKTFFDNYNYYGFKSLASSQKLKRITLNQYATNTYFIHESRLNSIISKNLIL